MKRLLVLLFLPTLLLLQSAKPRPVNLAAMTAPAGERIASNDPSAPVLPNGRVLTARGRQFKVAPHPFGLVLSPDGKRLIASCNGMDPFALAILHEPQSAAPQLQMINAMSKAEAKQSKLRDDEDDEFRTVFMGLAVAPDNRTLYAASGNQGGVFIFDLQTGQKLAALSLNDARHKDSFIGELALSRNGRFLYALDQAGYRVLVIDVNQRQVIESLPTGRAPFSLSLAPDGRRLFVTNVGLFRYSLIEGYDPQDPKRTALTFPPFGYPSDAMQRGATIEGKRVPGLGDPNDTEAASVWTYDVGADGRLKLAAQTKTGRLIGSLSNGVRVVGASSPSGIVAGSKHVFVSNANNDSVTVLDARTSRVVATIDLNLFQEVINRWRRRGLAVSAPQQQTLARLRGQIPFGLALGRDERRLYVAEAGINAVAVIDAQSFKLLGHIPTAWFPAQVQVSADGRQLYVANAKGFGAGPNGGPNFKLGAEGTYVGAIQKGVVSLIDLPADKQLAAETAQVIANNGFDLKAETNEPSVVPRQFGQASEQIKYVVFITKENRTHDHVFGDVTKDATGRALRAEPSLAIYGERTNIFDTTNKIALREVNVSPNHHALARRFSFSDNFYLDSDVSADGHRWLVGAYPNAWVETSLAAAYGSHRDFRPTNAAPGRLTFTGSAAAIHPEDYLESGSVWEHLHRAGVRFRNYGEGFELGGIDEGEPYLPTGGRFPVNYPMPGPLFENTARDFPTYNMNISDQYRLEQFKKDFAARFITGREPLPHFLNIYLPNDHTSKERPEDGYPYRASFVADNDLALGRVVEFLSHTPQWREMAIFVTEDDAQDGLDSIDAHRSLLLVISPYARRGYAMRQHASIAGIFKTIYLLLGIEPLNQYDAAAMDLREVFTREADFTPYTALPVDARIFDEKRVRMISRSSNEEEMELDATKDFARSHRRLAEQKAR